ncbi:hypothetical protein OGATHE_006660 [Ogataea polymorpha]|uniref:Uncharacterized protein n=1 Tax=Ogataea polymorpha TaxID=460523 RepID=A0A9P8NTR7_9ASCO|nr:hypothetical protein OGATHE_006660 [Ogataea polymorpha]
MAETLSAGSPTRAGTRLPGQPLAEVRLDIPPGNPVFGKPAAEAAAEAVAGTVVGAVVGAAETASSVGAGIDCSTVVAVDSTRWPETGIQIHLSLPANMRMFATTLSSLKFNLEMIGRGAWFTSASIWLSFSASSLSNSLSFWRRSGVVSSKTLRTATNSNNDMQTPLLNFGSWSLPNHSTSNSYWSAQLSSWYFSTQQTRPTTMSRSACGFSKASLRLSSVGFSRNLMMEHREVG